MTNLIFYNADMVSKLGHAWHLVHHLAGMGMLGHSLRLAVLLAYLT